MTKGELFEQALRRPPGYSKLPERKRFEIDKELGILDWDGSCPHSDGYPCENCEKKYYRIQGGI